MGAWSLYFIAKLGLYVGQFIDFHWALNLVFALALLWPLRQRGLRIARHIVAVPIAIALLYHDSWLPPVGRVIAQAGSLAGFSFAYTVELLGRFVNLKVILAIVLLGLFYALLRRRLRFATLVLLGIVSVPIAGAVQSALHPRPSLDLSADSTATLSATAGGDPASAPAVLSSPTAMLKAFYERAATERVTFAAPAADAVPFDIILLQVCSLSWDDMAFVDNPTPAVLNRFDIVFHNFNSAASYSGPAALRLMRSTCGQEAHKALYQSAPPQCYLFPNLREAGFKTEVVMNHDGRYEDFASSLESLGGTGVKPEDHADAAIGMASFDGTPIYNDFSVLSKWWARRVADNAPRVAMYYNTISLHDGNRLPGVKATASLETYKPRLAKLMDDFDRFVSELEAQGRPVLLVIVPEHGAAIRGDKMQISGLREIPSPTITKVPAAVKFIGFKQAEHAPIRVDTPTSYTALTTLMSTMLARNGFGNSPPVLADLVKALPRTEFVSENDALVVMRRGNGYVMRSGDGDWLDYEVGK